MTAPQRLYHLALREVHTAAGATFATYSGWSVPAHYGSAEAEHAAIRSAAALFDRSDRSRFMVTGTDALDVLRDAFAGHIEELEEGRAMRTAALDAHGNVADLVLIARTGGIAYLVVGEPGQREETLDRLRAAVRSDYDARVDDRTDSTCLLAIAGPAAGDILRDHLADALPARLQSLHTITFEFHGFRALATRTSGVGEDGFELMLAPAVAEHVISLLAEAGVPLAGRDAQEIARVESCVPSFDPDLLPGLSPAEADIDVLFGLPGGRDERILSAVLFEGETAPATGVRLIAGGIPAGELRSVVTSPGLRAVIGLGLLPSRLALPGAAVDADGVRGTIVSKPFYRRRT